jgi:hypothetical protein
MAAVPAEAQRSPRQRSSFRILNPLGAHQKRRIPASLGNSKPEIGRKTTKPNKRTTKIRREATAGGGMQAYEHSGTPFQQKQARVMDAQARILANIKEMRQRFPDMSYDFIVGKVQAENRKLFDILKDGEDNSNTTPSYEQSRYALAALISEMKPHELVHAAMAGHLKNFN